MATTVAGDEPDTAANSRAGDDAAERKPPAVSNEAVANRIIRWPRRRASGTWPARMKNGSP